MLTVEEARARILKALEPLPAERVAPLQADNRVLAVELHARLTQPPHAVSAMDGYALRAADLGRASFTIVGEVAAGHPLERRIEEGEAARIFTGGVMPAGSDTVVIQENARRDGPILQIDPAPRPHANVRPAGGDFALGESLIAAGTRLTPRHLGLIAANGLTALEVHRRPRIGILQTGDEILAAGESWRPGAIYGSATPLLAGLISRHGGEAVDLGIAPDEPVALRRAVAAARGLDLLVTCGGASVGDHDLMGDLLRGPGDRLDFWKIAMRPGKPLMFGTVETVPVMGLPGNPVSGHVCALLFLLPALARLQGTVWSPRILRRPLATGLAANGAREHYLRAALHEDGSVSAQPNQDSSLLSVLAQSDGLIRRVAEAEAAEPGTRVDFLPFELQGG